MAIVVGSASFPQKSANRTRGKFIEELADHTGGRNRPDVVTRAGDCLDAAVREYNTVHWAFNRMLNDITLVADTADYTLATDFDAPLLALLLDASGNSVCEVIWVPYELWAEFFPVQVSTGGMPLRYTARNVHETGLVTVDPKMGSSITYPTMRIHYFRRLLIASGEDDRLNVPVEVEEAIFQLALAKFVRKIEGAKAAVSDYQIASAMRNEVERKHRDFGRRI